MTALRIYTFYIYAGKDNPSGGAETYETVGTNFFVFFSKLEIQLIFNYNY